MHLAPGSSIGTLRFDLKYKYVNSPLKTARETGPSQLARRLLGSLLGTRRSVRELSRFAEDVNTRKGFSFSFPELRRIQLQNKWPTFDGLKEME